MGRIMRRLAAALVCAFLPAIGLAVPTLAQTGTITLTLQCNAGPDEIV